MPAKILRMLSNLLTSMEFAAIIACVFTVIFFIINLFFSHFESIKDKILFSLFMGGITFIAVLILSQMDNSDRKRTLKQIRKFLNKRDKISDEEFRQEFLGDDQAIALKVRETIAIFYDVPKESIHPNDNLRDVLKFKIFQPAICSAIAYQCVPELGRIKNRVITLPGGNNFNEIISEVKRLKNSLN